MSLTLLPVVAPAAGATSAPTSGAGKTVSARTTDGASGERPSFGAMVSELAGAESSDDGAVAPPPLEAASAARRRDAAPREVDDRTVAVPEPQDDPEAQGVTAAVAAPPDGDALPGDAPATLSAVHGELTAAVGEFSHGGIDGGTVAPPQPDTLPPHASAADQGQPEVVPRQAAMEVGVGGPAPSAGPMMAGPPASSSATGSQEGQEPAPNLDGALETAPATPIAGGAPELPEVGQAPGATDAGAPGVAMPLPVEAPAPPAPLMSSWAPARANDLAGSQAAPDPVTVSIVASVATPGGLAEAHGRSRGGLSAGAEARRDQRSLRMNDSPGPVQAAFGASDAGAADAEGLPLEGLRADLSTLGVEVVHTSQNPPAGAGAGSGAVDPSLGGPSDATSNAPRLPAVAATGGALTSLPLGDFARSLAMSSYAASGPVETPEAAPRWTLGPFEAESPHQQVVRAVRLQWANGVSEARLRLHPEHLGDVTIDLRVEQGRVSASLRLDNPAAAEWIRAQRAELQASLSAQGLDLGTLEIVVDPDGRRRQPATPDPQPRSRVRRQGSETPRFEVLA